MAKEVACIVKKSYWLSDGFVSWCGIEWPTSRSAGWFTPTCEACERAKKEAKG